MSQKGGTEKKKKMTYPGIKPWTFGLKVLYYVLKLALIVHGFDKNVGQVFLYTNIFTAL